MRALSNSINSRGLVFGLVVVCLAVVGTAVGGTIYVDGSASGSNNGSSWPNAYNYLQDALADANSLGVPVEIWVAEGTYKPDQGAGITPGDRHATFQLINGVEIYGGFAGGESSLHERDWQTNETILSGDLGIAGDNGDNSYHVVTGSGTNNTAVLDGFTITAGNIPSGFGGGMYNNNGSPTLTNCTFTDNSADWGGGMMNNESSSPTITNCTFSGNSASNPGGGMYNLFSSPTLTNCTFTDNSARANGGGMFNNASSPTVTNCTFSGNSARKGGGMENWSYSNPTLTDCIFTGNSAVWGGGMHNLEGSSPTLNNCTFSNNSCSKGEGGGMLNYWECSPTITNCVFIGNSAYYDGGGMSSYYGRPTLTNCTFSGNSAMSDWEGYGGGGMKNATGGDATVTNCTFSNNYSGSEGGGMYNTGSSPTVTNCTFTDNSAVSYGGGMFNFASSRATVTNCTFSGNSASKGGGMSTDYNSRATVTNCTFSENSANHGGGMHTGGRWTWISSTLLTNCILWGNTSPSGPQIYNDVGGSATVSYSDVQGGWPGEGNADADPRFVDTNNDDYHLLPDSPCIDAGDNNSVPADAADLDGDGNTAEPVPWDLDSRTRFADGDCNGTVVVDMGAYEFAWVYLGDFDGQCDVDVDDLAVLCDEWLLEELSADVWPEGGDGFVNFLDWAIFADGWQTTVDFDDLAEFADQWLKTGANYLIADIAPPADGDGIVNMLDFAALANNWLAGL